MALERVGIQPPVVYPCVGDECPPKPNLPSVKLPVSTTAASEANENLCISFKLASAPGLGSL